ncbi:LLM class flavin-dependent oxidoreductase [uncultured Phycicoccus sp.]|uniref:LLM class flavin-dependent oxidoreductase n=1 Tax=uncultured Phycicoccus sp. TaxID=661422 RepID=UPI002614BA71|nr:LLM class flavin-dependent oxidoreductase [uncultured Phycicoccus sp.]
MRIGPALGLDATASSAAEVSWPHLLDLARHAETLGFDLVALPDHLYYPAGGDGDYSDPDEDVGVRESTVMAAALAAATTRIRLAHSVVNATYRPPALLAHVADTLDEISGGRYSPGVGAGNTVDFEAIGVGHDHRVARLEEYVAILRDLLRDGSTDRAGRYWSAVASALPLRDTARTTPALVVAAAGPRSMRLAARHADGWNGWVRTRDAGAHARDLIDALDRACAQVGRDPGTLARTVDLTLDPLDVVGAAAASRTALEDLAALGVDEVRCYLASDPTHTARRDAMSALAELVDGLVAGSPAGPSAS